MRYAWSRGKIVLVLWQNLKTGYCTSPMHDKPTVGLYFARFPSQFPLASDQLGSREDQEVKWPWKFTWGSNVVFWPPPHMQIGGQLSWAFAFSGSLLFSMIAFIHEPYLCSFYRLINFVIMFIVFAKYFFLLFLPPWRISGTNLNRNWYSLCKLNEIYWIPQRKLSDCSFRYTGNHSLMYYDLIVIIWCLCLWSSYLSDGLHFLLN